MTVTLYGIEAAALEVIAEGEDISPAQLLQDLIRDAAINMMSGNSVRRTGDIKIKNHSEKE